MIGVPMPNPRDAIIDDLNRQLDALFGAGKSALLGKPDIQLPARKRQRSTIRFHIFFNFH